MTLNTFNTGSAMAEYLISVHNIPVKVVTKKRDTEIFVAEFYQRQENGEPISMKHHVQSPEEYAKQIANALGGVRIVDTHQTIADWVESKPRTDATVKFELIDTIFKVNQWVKLLGTSRTLQISAVWQSKESSRTFYHLDVNAGAVRHQWVEEGRLEDATILPVAVKRSEPAKVAEKRKPMLFGQTTMFPYGTFQIVK